MRGEGVNHPIEPVVPASQGFITLIEHLPQCHVMQDIEAFSLGFIKPSSGGGGGGGGPTPLSSPPPAEQAVRGLWVARSAQWCPDLKFQTVP